MTYDLAIGDRAYSSWSLRGWLLFDAFNIPVRTHLARLYTDEPATLLQSYKPARLLPTARTEDGTVIAETIAIAEELASRHPQAGHWPADPKARAIARALVAEMHAGFTALRTYCPMNLRVSYADCAPPDAVLADLARLDLIWSHARREIAGQIGSQTAWLCGPYSAADAFFAPVAARIAGYNLPVSPAALAYSQAHLAHPGFRRWRAMSQADGPDQDSYRRDYPRRPWPGPEPMAAQVVATGPSVNQTCPYSGEPVRYFLQCSGKVWGFCNRFCRDKTLADPLAWPAFTAIFQP